MGISFESLEWARKPRGRMAVSAKDVYISSSKAGKGKQYVFYFRTAKLPPSAEYIQIARFGNLLLFKLSDSHSGWKMAKTMSLSSTRSIQINSNALSDNIKELLNAHIHEGFDLQFEVKEKIYYVDMGQKATAYETN